MASSEVYARDGSDYVVYYDSEPEYLNVLDLGDWDAMRSGMMFWSGQVSDREGCWTFLVASGRSC